MAYVQMTPQERMQRARQLRAMREARLGYQPSSESLLSNYLLPTERSVGRTPTVSMQPTQPTYAPNVMREEEDEEQDVNYLDIGRWGATGLDIASKAISVPVMMFEQIFDVGASLLGNVGGVFSEEFKKEVEKVVSYDATNEWLREPLDEMGLKHSYLNEEGAGQFFDSIFEGTAQLATIAGLAAIPGVGPGITLATLGTSAAGGGIQEALSDGADLWDATKYGAITGAIEAGVESLLPGVSKTVFGKGLINVGKEVAEQGGRRILKGMVEEGIEEGLSALANPIAKTTYKGAEALGEYLEPEFWGEVATDAAAGALVSGVYEGSIGRVLRQTGRDADISDAQEAMGELQKNRRKLQAEGKLDDATDERIVNAGRTNLENISKVLKAASPKQRERLIRDHRLQRAFDESGDLKPDFADSVFGRASTTPDPQTGLVEKNLGTDVRYYSANLRGQEAKVQKDVKSIEDSLKKTVESATRAELQGKVNDTELQRVIARRVSEVKVTPFTGELSESGQANLGDLYRVTNAISDHTSTGMNVALVDSGGNMNAVILQDGNTIYVDKSAVEDGTFAKPLVEEVTHFAEGTESYQEIVDFLSEDDALRQGVFDTMTAEGNAYGFTEEAVDGYLEKARSGKKITLTQEEKRIASEVNAHMAAATLGNERFMQKLIKGKPNLAEKLINRIKALKAALSRSESADAKAQRKRLEKAEKLWMEAVEDAGARFLNNKIIGASEEEPTVQFSLPSKSGVDNSAEEGYNGGKQKNVEEGLYDDGEGTSRSNGTRTPQSAQSDEGARKTSERGFELSRGDRETSKRNERILVLGRTTTKLGRKEIAFSKTDCITPKIGSVEKDIQERLYDYGVDNYVVKKSVWNRKGNATTRNGVVYMSEGLTERDRLILVPHEITHVMDQVEYPPYKDFLTRTPLMLDFSSSSTAIFLKEVAEHCECDVDDATSVDDFDKIYDELNCTSFGHYSAGDATNLEYAARFKSEIADCFYDFNSYILELESIHAQFKEDMLEVKRMLDERDSAQFSLPSKPQSAGARAKSNANRSRSKTYTYEDSKRITEAVMADSTVFADEAGRTFRAKLMGKGKLIEELWVKLNDTDEASGKRDGVALDLADAAIAHTMVTLSADDPVMEAFTERADVLRSYMHKFDLSSIKEDLKHARGNEKGAMLALRSRWQKKDGGGMTPDQIVEELRDRGVVIDTDNPSDILLEMDRMYTEAVDFIAENTNVLLAQILTDEQLNAYRQKLAKRFLRASEGKGSMSKLARSYYEQYERKDGEYERAKAENEKALQKAIEENDEKNRKDIEKRREQLEKARGAYRDHLSSLNTKLREFEREMKQKFSEQDQSARLIRSIAFRAQRFKDFDLGKMHTVSEYNDKRFKGVFREIATIVRGGQLSVTKARKVFSDLADWMGWINDVNRDAGIETDGRLYDLQDIRTTLQHLADGKGKFSVSDLQSIVKVMNGIYTYVTSYNKVRRKGKLMEARPIAEQYITHMIDSNRIPRGLVRKMYEGWYMGKFADPVTVMRYADLYTNGFFTDTFEEFREGAVKVAITRMELMEAYRSFMEEHRGYAERLENETIECRGQRLPVGVALSLWMTSKRQQAQLGLVKSGAQYRIDPKDKKAKRAANGVKVFDIPPLGDSKADYTEGDLEQMMRDLRSELEAHFTETDRAYLKTVEGIFSACADIKIDVDMTRLGYTNVDKDQYYYPIARADKAENIDTETWREGLDRVSHLSMNQNTVKGAYSRLSIGSADAVLKRHVNQVSIYNGLAEAVDNFNVLLNLNIHENRGAPTSVLSTAKRTDFGKAAIDYIKKLKQDIEQVNQTELDDRGFSRFFARLRGKYASYQLGMNPKVWVTQLSSLIAANNVLDADSIVKGFALVSDGKPNKIVEVQHKEIVPGMGEEERASVLRGKSIRPHPIQIAEGFDVDWEALEKNRKSVVEKPLLKKLREFGFLRDYQTNSIDVEFEFTSQGLRKSMNSQVSDYGGNLGDLAKVVMNLQPLLDNAVLIETHPDKAKGTPKENTRLLQTYVLLSAYAEGNTVTPVQFEVKQYVDNQNRLYLAVAMTKIETSVLGDTALQGGERTRLIPVSDISIAQLIEKINPADENFFKYVPDTMLTEEQRRAKHRALEKEAKKYGKSIEELLNERNAAPDKKKEAEVDKYCPLAKHRHLENEAYEAQSVSAKVTNKVGEVLMKPIGAVDRFVIERLWGACQVQVEKNDGAKVGTKENKEAAGKLLERVILETQQNALATERSSAMRSTSEFQRTITMYSADAMKMIGRFLDSFGEYYTIRQQLKHGNLSEDARKALEERRPEAFKKLLRSIAVLTSSAVFMAAIAAGFKALLSQWKDKEPEEITEEIVADGVGNLLGGLPLFRDAYGFFFNGYELDSYMYSTINDLLGTAKDLTDFSLSVAVGEADSRDFAKLIRRMLYAGGQVTGIPTRNVYKYATGLINTFFPEAGYTIDAAFVKPSYKKDLKKAIEAGDTRMITRIAELMTDEHYGMYSDGTRKALQALVEEGYTVFPRSVGNTVTVNGETFEMTDAQRKRFEKVYAVSDRAVEDLVELAQFKDADSEERARALKYVYDTYYAIALDDLLGTDTETKSVLFAEVIDIEKLAMITAHVSSLTADRDKQGKTVSGSRKNKVVAYVNSLRLTAAEKYVVMGYLGYKNLHGAAQVKALINRADLSKKEKEKVLAYCGYAA